MRHGYFRALRKTVRKMLKENGKPPQGKWADIAYLEPVRDYKARHASTMLTFDAVVDAIGQIEAKQKQPASAKGGRRRSCAVPTIMFRTCGTAYSRASRE
jgi:hypothetical protein